VTEVWNYRKIKVIFIRKNVLSNYGDLLNIEELSTIFDVSKNTIYKSVKDGKFGTPIQIGRAYKVPKTYIIRKFFRDYE